MKRKIEHILLAILWLLAATLGISFWFRTRYGFNIFSAAHWQYLSYLQAAQAPVKSGFYTSMALGIFITILGLYLLLRPRFHKIRLPIIRTKKTSVSQNAINTAAPHTHTVSAPMPQPVTQSYVPAPSPGPAGMRPPRLNPGAVHTITPVATHGSTSTPALTTPTITTPAPQSLNVPLAAAPAITAPNIDEIKQIFSDAGYMVKPAPRLGGVQTMLLAIGANETLWLGAFAIPTSDMQRASDNLNQIFLDTLDDITIEINSFIIAAPDAATATGDVLQFGNITQLREYMMQHPNPTTPDDDIENMNAYSEYIDTVLTYVGKM